LFGQTRRRRRRRLAQLAEEVEAGGVAAYVLYAPRPLAGGVFF